MVQINHVNPIYINCVEQIHKVGGTPHEEPCGVPSNHDLLLAPIVERNRRPET